MQKSHGNLTKIAALLSDSQYHDGTSIGKQLGITRAAVWKVIKKLQAYGIPVKSIKAKGYILEKPVKLLEQSKINELITSPLARLDIFEYVDSTNNYLKKLSINNEKPIVCLAETQTQGRGRFNRDWHSPFGQNIYLSLAYPLQKDTSELSGLSLVIALASCKAIESVCKLPAPLAIKWPNDIIAEQKKLSGSLIELQAESHGFCHIIIGMGVNVNMQQDSSININSPWTSIQEITHQYHDRNIICAELINQTLSYLHNFEKYGLNNFMAEWKTRDYLFNKPVCLTSNQVKSKGKGSGINPQGQLILEMKSGDKQAFASGDTTLKVNT